MILAVTGVRTKIIRMIPKSVMLATSAGIGLYLAHIGLQKSEGLNIVTYDSATIVTLGESLVSMLLFQGVSPLQVLRHAFGHTARQTADVSFSWP